MKLTTKGRYAVAAMLDLAYHYPDGRPVTLADISHRQSISRPYLEQLFAKLRRRGLVRSIRGPGGGYALTDSPAKISVAAIIRAVDEPIQATACGLPHEGKCHNHGRCLTHDLWKRLSEHINDFLESVNLGALAEQRALTGHPLPLEGQDP